MCMLCICAYVITVGQVVELYIIMCAGGGEDKITCSNYCWRRIHFTMAFCIEKRTTWPQQMVVYFDLFRSCLQSTSYILVETVLRPAAPRRYHGYWDWLQQEIAGINNPPLAAAASDSVAVETLKLLTESHQPLVLSTDWFWQLVFSCRGSIEPKLSVPDFVSHCLEITKSGTETLGSRLLEVAACLHSHVSRQPSWVRGYWRWLHAYTHT